MKPERLIVNPEIKPEKEIPLSDVLRGQLPTPLKLYNAGIADIIEGKRLKKIVQWQKSSAGIISSSGEGIEEVKRIEQIGRVCYASGDKITEDSYIQFIQNLIKRGHESVLEHGCATAYIVTDRGTTHEIVRHRIASYSQESTRYVTYGDKHPLTLIEPEEFSYEEYTDCDLYKQFKLAAENAAFTYLDLTKHGVKPQDARHILPNCMATTIVMSANYREWRHFFIMRCSKAAHPNIRVVSNKLLIDMHDRIPIIFDDLFNEFIGGNENG